MAQVLRVTRQLFLETAAVVLLLAVAMPAWAKCSENASYTSWYCCWWSVPRWVVFFGVSTICWFVCFWGLFPNGLRASATAKNKANRTLAPWPRTVFGQTLGMFFLMVTITFVFFFGVLSDELRRNFWDFSTSPLLSWLNDYWPIFLTLLIGLALFGLCLFLFRHPKEATT